MDAEGGGALVGCLRFVLLCKLGLYYAAHSRYEVDESTQHEGIHPGVLVPGGVDSAGILERRRWNATRNHEAPLDGTLPGALELSRVVMNPYLNSELNPFYLIVGVKRRKAKLCCFRLS